MTARASDADMLALLRAIRADVAALRADLARGGSAPAPPLRDALADALALLLPVLCAAFGTAPFAAWQVFDLAKQHTADGASLRLALAGRSAPQLGKLLRAGHGHVCNGLRVERAGRDNTGTIWQIVRVV